MNKLIIYLLFSSTLILTSCDAWVQMGYVVKNKSANEVKIFVPIYTIDKFNSIKDTTLTINPNEERRVFVDDKLDFPWGRKNIYRKNPGVCGIKRLDSDTTISLGCSKKEWKYKRGVSVLILK